MRALGSAILATGLMLAPLAQAATDCARPDDARAFAVIGLKSELMVTAISCHSQDKYNAFMTRYRSEFANEEKALNAYFKRAYGRSATKAHDDYITSLANVQSHDGLQAGTAFCASLEPMFDEVMSLHDASELNDYAHAKAIVQPVSVSDCGATVIEASTGKHPVRKKSGKSKRS
jgi:hypothetical protein